MRCAHGAPSVVSGRLRGCVSSLASATGVGRSLAWPHLPRHGACANAQPPRPGRGYGSVSSPPIQRVRYLTGAVGADPLVRPARSGHPREAGPLALGERPSSCERPSDEGVSPYGLPFAAASPSCDRDRPWPPDRPESFAERHPPVSSEQRASAGRSGGSAPTSGTPDPAVPELNDPVRADLLIRPARWGGSREDRPPAHCARPSSCGRPSGELMSPRYGRSGPRALLHGAGVRSRPRATPRSLRTRRLRRAARR